MVYSLYHKEDYKLTSNSPYSNANRAVSITFCRTNEEICPRTSRNQHWANHLVNGTNDNHLKTINWTIRLIAKRQFLLPKQSTKTSSQTEKRKQLVLEVISPRQQRSVWRKNWKTLHFYRSPLTRWKAFRFPIRFSTASFGEMRSGRDRWCRQCRKMAQVVTPVLSALNIKNQSTATRITYSQRSKRLRLQTLKKNSCGDEAKNEDATKNNAVTVTPSKSQPKEREEDEGESRARINSTIDQLESFSRRVSSVGIRASPGHLYSELT